MSWVICNKATECQMLCKLTGVEICNGQHHEPHGHCQVCDIVCDWRPEMGGACVPVEEGGDDE